MKTFAQYMDEALYGPEGYYSSGKARSGKAGDYFTAPDVGPIFGQLLAEIFKGWKEKLGEPFVLIEAGAGEGRLARDILKAHPFRYIAVERSPARQKLLCDMEVYADLSTIRNEQGVLFGNELIDAFPVHRIRMKNGKLEEAYIPDSWGSPSTPRLQHYFDRLKVTLPEGYETEVNLAMADWLKEAARALKRGLVVLIDYGRPAHEYYDPERSSGTLRGFSKHRIVAPSPSPLPGERVQGEGTDLTADVDFTSLALDAKEAGFIPLAFMEMGTFLLQAVDRIPPPPRPTALRYLLHPEGLGAAFHVLILGKNVDPPEWTFEHNRLSRLGLHD